MQETSKRPGSARRPGNGSRRREWIILAIILLAGAALRVSYLQEIGREPVFHVPVADAAFHDYWARGIVSSDWTPPAGEPDPRIPQVPFLRPPGYAYFLAGIYAVFGADVQAALLVQMLLGLVSCVLAYVLGRALFRGAVGLILAGFCAVYWSFIYYEAQLHAPALLIPLTLGLMLLLREWALRPALWKAFLAGLLLGLLSLVRAETLLFIPVAFFWVAWLRARTVRGWASFGPGVALALGAALAIAPATLRNAIVAKEFVLVSANGPINFYIGNNETSDGWSTRIPGLAHLIETAGWSCFSYDQIVQALCREAGRPPTYANAGEIFTDRALGFIGSNFPRFVGLTFKRAALFWGPREVANNVAIEDEKGASATLGWMPGFPWVLAPSLLGAGLLIREARRRRGSRVAGAPNAQAKEARSAPSAGARDAQATEAKNAPGEEAKIARPRRIDPTRPLLVLIGLFILTGFVALLPFIVAARFRVPYLPLIFLFGAYAIYELVGLIRERAWRRLGLPLGALVVLLGFAHVSLAAYRTDPAWYPTDRALALWRVGRTDEALIEFKRALAANPGFVDAHVNLAGLLTELGRTEEAAAHYREVLVHRPDRADLRLRLGLLLVDQGKAAEARRELEGVVRDNPNVPDAWFALGRALDRLGDYEGSRAAYAHTLELLPDEPASLVNQGMSLVKQGKAREALPLIQRAAQLKPDLAEAFVWLGQAQMALGDAPAARAAYQEAIRLDMRNPVPYINLGILAGNAKDFDEAVRWLRQAVRIAPNDAIAHYNLGGMLASRGDFPEATAEFEQAVRLDPSNQLARQQLAAMRARQP